MGEIAVHTPRIVSGYYKNSEKTEEAFVYVDNKRYYKTGDIGRLTKIQGGRTHVTLLDRCVCVYRMTGTGTREERNRKQKNENQAVLLGHHFFLLIYEFLSLVIRLRFSPNLLKRCKAVTKLATSEWISPTNLESILEENPWVAQAFVVASPEYNFPVALVVPSHIVISEGFAREVGEHVATTFSRDKGH